MVRPRGSRPRLNSSIPATATGFVLPLCASVFKLTSAIYWVVGALFAAKLYGIDLPDVVLKKVYYQNALRIMPAIQIPGWPK